MDNPRILLLDVETAPKIAYVWQTFKTNVTVDQIVSDTYLLSYAAKWLGDKKIVYDSQAHAKSLPNDTRLLWQIHDLLDEADIVVAHNGQAFDLPFVITRMVAANIPPPSPFKQIDTYKVAKKQFGFTFNKLEFLAKALKCRTLKNKHRNFPGMELWKECLNRNQDAWKEMAVYNKDDVYVLEEVYIKMRPWIEGHPNVGIYHDFGRPVCPKCGGMVERRGTAYTNTGRYQKYHCLDCGGYSRGRLLLKDRQYRVNQLVN